MALKTSLAIIAAAASAVSGAPHEATVDVLATSTGTQFSESAGPLHVTQYAGMLSTILGLSSPIPYNWKGILPSGLFNRPRTVASIVIEGPKTDFRASSIRSFPLAFGPKERNLGDALHALAGGRPGHTAAAVPELVSTVFGSRATVVTVSADPDAATAAGLGYGDASMHTVHRGNGEFIDSAINDAPIAITSSIDWNRFDGVTFDSTTGIAKFGDVSFNGDDLDIFSELDAMFDVATALRNHVDSHPSVLTFTISTLAPIASRHGADSAIAEAAQQIVAAAVPILARQLEVAYGEKAVVFAVSLGSGIDRDTPPHVAQSRVRRQAVNAAANSTLNESVPLAAYAEYPQHFTVDNCARYKCSCFAPYTAYQSLPAYKESCGTRCYNFSEVNNVSFAAKSSLTESAGCIQVPNTKGLLCVWDQAACDCSSEFFFQDDGNGVTGVQFLYPGKKLPLAANASNSSSYDTITANTGLRMSVDRSPNRMQSTDPKCIRCAFGFTLSNGICYRDNSETASMQAALWTGLAGIAGLTGMWYVLHQITYGGKWAYLGEVPDIPDAKKTS